MMRLVPRSLFGQVMLATAAALLIAQAISTTLLYRAAEQRRELAIANTAAFQLVTGETRGERGRGERGPRLVRDGGRDFGGLRLPRRLRYAESTASPLAAGDLRMTDREDTVREVLEAQGVAIAELVVIRRPMLSDPIVAGARDRFPRLAGRLREAPGELLVVGLRQQGSDTWQIARLPIPARDRTIMGTLVFQTLILFIVLFGLLWFVLRRITRPLAALADSTARFAGAGTPGAPIPATGPDDVRHLIEAHNAMQSRIGAMLDEKDVMLGAIGHDLKTPLAALRVRIESVENDAARDRMAATIEEITQTLDDILSLARVGRAGAPPEVTELGALAASVVEEFEDMGQPVTLETTGRVAAPVHLTWLKRGLRNLVTNALRYGGSAEVTVVREGDEAVLRVADRGPGIPEARLAEMLEPFTRGEASRNRETGGAGLGLTIARAVAEQHGGRLVLMNRAEGGLSAEIRLPL
ncbi:HAMP domain-containing protein [Qipengyuania sp. 6B39]|uniref:ATP-binding protein n=1 Tax=Qipengyuania proteolytica TaxID=2867239 RepID=UPI001C8A128E|nr:ATP-binding protein [Qipengyuania proteolytica]MBX7494827.1 HAMP domain-containing protein [Qipengyuania proteolytica]